LASGASIDLGRKSANSGTAEPAPARIGVANIVAFGGAIFGTPGPAMNDSSQISITDYLRTLRRSLWLIVLVTLLCAGAAVAYVQLKTPSYESTAQLTVRDPSQDLGPLGAQASGAQLPLQLAAAHAPDVTRTEVLQQVKKDLGLTQSLDQIRALVAVDIDPNAFTVKVTAKDSDADDAAAIANAFAQADARLTTADQRERYAASASRFSGKLKALRQSGDPTAAAIAANRVSTLQGLAATAQPVVVSATAQPPDSPTSPKPVLDIAAATIFGFFLGIGLAYARSVFDRRLRDSSAVEEVFGYPVLGRLRRNVLGHTGSAEDVESGPGPLDPLDSEAFRMLRENLRYLAVDRELRTIAVTSAIPEEGKSSVAACLAMASTASGTRTLLVECDLRKRVLADRFGIEGAPGLSDYLAGRNEPGDVLQQVPASGAQTANGSTGGALVCITAGSPPPRPADVLSSDRFTRFLKQVGKAYERVIIDCPPLLPVADTLEIVPHVDCVLMCVRLNRTTHDQAQAAQKALERLPGRPVGLVLTDFTQRDTGYYRGYYQYADSLGAPAREGEPVA
jgi:succinoglycan biosynthesis transport protein ExoP